jgi:2-polyprenyl-3-methyl-5-hydroxy-6-metoxy-1,4-benzoquinol methylase
MAGLMDDIYRNTAPENIPWNSTTPPVLLRDLVESGIIKPCKAIDIGCGLGYYTYYLATKGFDVTGVDISVFAINKAKEKFQKKDLSCRFKQANLLDKKLYLGKDYDFAFDWEVLHHIYPEERVKYLKNVYRLLNTKGKYLSICFSEQDPQFGGKGKYRKTALGTTLYFSSENELQTLFSQFFRIIDLKTVKLEGKKGYHMAVYAFMEKV